MFKLFKKPEKTVQEEVTSFLQQEKERRKKAEAFLHMMLDVFPYVMEEVWGLSDNKIAIGDTVLFRVDTKVFYVLKNKSTNLDVMTLRGQAFWQSVQEIMNFAHDLLEDIQQREAGRNQLLFSMEQLTQRMKESSVGVQKPVQKKFARMEPQFLRASEN
ncbi:hypothetical protein UY286_04795 [Paenibacillus polymyxa]|uniref:hypothetical protein n=1 Tax=Paenibacillus polymyxa TaxID=1406 RepID=UPI002AB35CB1|nr:hypothetical protein [Paenibacillus polymyxa]MDY7989885.1 hypothetical protein [Paenibacillus polymyxa]MDY8116756.1 hypothetical protein [Paenibacillus polymyxa]